MTSGAEHARSLLFVPADRPDRFEKAAATGADAVILDLEDAVAPPNKESALRNALAWLEAGNSAVVRVNPAGTQWYEAEIAALAGTGATLMLPKSQDPAELAAAHVASRSPIIALVETALGVRSVDALASTPGVNRLALGNVDLAAELGVDPASRSAMSYARGRLVVASAAAGIAAPIDGVTTRFDSASDLAGDLEVTRDLGFGGKLCIHPKQVEPVNAALLPTDEEFAWARRILAAAPSSGVSVVDGFMVDPPVIRRAQRILSREPRSS